MSDTKDAIAVLEDLRDTSKAGLNLCHRLGTVGSQYHTRCERELAALTLAIETMKAAQPPSTNDAPTTRLPDTINQKLIGSHYDLTIRAVGNEWEARARWGVHIHSAIRLTPEAAIDALAAQLAGKDKQPLPDHGMAHGQE